MSKYVYGHGYDYPPTTEYCVKTSDRQVFAPDLVAALKELTGEIKEIRKLIKDVKSD